MGEEESTEVGLEKKGTKELKKEKKEKKEKRRRKRRRGPSDSEIENPLDWLDLKDGAEAVADGAFTPNSIRGARILTRGFTLVPGSPTLQPLSNRSHKLSSHIRAIRLWRSGREG